MEYKQRKAVWDSLRKYDPAAEENAFIEVTEWINGMGIDVVIDDTHYSLSYDILEAINYLSKSLGYYNEED